MPEYGELVEIHGGPGVMVYAPTECSNGHRLRGNVVLSTRSCTCPERSHTSWSCRTCDDVTWGPAHGPDCRTSSGTGSLYG